MHYSSVVDEGSKTSRRPSLILLLSWIENKNPDANGEEHATNETGGTGTFIIVPQRNYSFMCAHFCVV